MVLLIIVPLLADLGMIEYRRIWPKKEEEARPRRRGRKGEPESPENPLVRALGTIRDRLPFDRGRRGS